MQSYRQPTPKFNSTITQHKEQGKYTSIFNKRKLDQMLSARRASSFATTHDFFETTYAFMPSSVAISPQKDKAIKERKQNFKLYKNLKLPDFDSFSRLIRTQPQTKHNSSQNKQYAVPPRHQTISFFRTASVTPSKRSQKSYKVRRVAQVTPINQKRQPYLQNTQHTIAEDNVVKVSNQKMRSYKLKQRFNYKSEDVDGQTLTGWNMKSVMFQAEIQVL